jgi:hypothetical protein
LGLNNDVEKRVCSGIDRNLSDNLGSRFATAQCLDYSCR